MKFKIDPAIFERFPKLHIGVVVAKEINNRGVGEDIMRLIRDKEREIRRKYDMETLSQNQRIASWRRAYSSFGAKPKKYKSSVESLYRMILKEINLRDINKIVNIYNYISLKHMVPAGGDDMAKIEGDMALEFARGYEPFTALNSTETDTVEEGEVIYADEREVLCRRWNWRECDKTKMTEETRDVVLVVEGLPPVTREEIEKAGKDLALLIEKYCGGEIKRDVLDEKKTEIEMS